MYAVIKTGGKQYKVSPGDLLVVEKLAGEPGAKVAFDQVLMLGDGEAVVVGAPLIDGAKVSATLIETRKGDKIKVFKKIRRQGYRRTRGHRQVETVVRVTGIDGDGQSEAWAGEVDLTSRAELRLRSRNLARLVDAAAVRADAQAAFEHDEAAVEVRPTTTKPKAAKAGSKPVKTGAKAEANSVKGSPKTKATTTKTKRSDKA